MLGGEAIKNLRTMAMQSLLVHLPFLYFGAVVIVAIYIGVARALRPRRHLDKGKI